MSAQIPNSHRDLIDGPVYVTFTTVMPDGQPQSTITWCNSDGDHILINTTRGRQKEKNLLNHPKATVFAVDPNNPFRALEVRGTVVEMTEAGAVEHISELARLYVGAANYYGDFAPAERAAEETRIICKLKPTKVNVIGE